MSASIGIIRDWSVVKPAEGMPPRIIGLVKNHSNRKVFPADSDIVTSPVDSVEFLGDEWEVTTRSGSMYTLHGAPNLQWVNQLVRSGTSVSAYLASI